MMTCLYFSFCLNPFNGINHKMMRIYWEISRSKPDRVVQSLRLFLFCKSVLRHNRAVRIARKRQKKSKTERKITKLKYAFDFFPVKLTLSFSLCISLSLFFSNELMIIID